MEIHHKLATHVPEGSMEPWKPFCDGADGYLSFDASNRYFTEDARTDEHAVPFHPQVDPLDILRGRAPHSLRHVADNQVLYYERVKNGDR